GSVGLCTCDAGLEARLDVVVTLGGALAGDEGNVALINVRGDQGGGLCVGTGDDDGRGVGDVRCQAGGVQGADVLLGRDEDLATEVAALLLGGELILPVGAGGTGVDHGLLQLVDVEGATEAGLTVSDDRNEPVLHGGVTLDAGDLVGAQQSVVDAADNVGDGVCRVEGLVGVGVAGEVGITCDLPTGQVDSLQAGADLLDSLVAGEGAQCVDVVVALCGNCIPED